YCRQLSWMDCQFLFSAVVPWLTSDGCSRKKFFKPWFAEHAGFGKLGAKFSGTCPKAPASVAQIDSTEVSECHVKAKTEDIFASYMCRTPRSTHSGPGGPH
ncbi:hypothetical protein EDD16DRAFT_1617302, partial [Pisolithus croceorrhizus]